MGQARRKHTRLQGLVEVGTKDQVGQVRRQDARCQGLVEIPAERQVGQVLRFDRPVALDVLPTSLDHLVFGPRFNQLLTPGALPANWRPKVSWVSLGGSEPTSNGWSNSSPVCIRRTRGHKSGRLSTSGPHSTRGTMLGRTIVPTARLYLQRCIRSSVVMKVLR